MLPSLILIFLSLILTVSPAPKAPNYLSRGVRPGVFVGDGEDTSLTIPTGAEEEIEKEQSSKMSPVLEAELYYDDVDTSGSDKYGEKVPLRKQMLLDANGLLRSGYFIGRRAVLNYVDAVQKMLFSDTDSEGWTMLSNKKDTGPGAPRRRKEERTRYGSKQEVDRLNKIKSVVLRGDQESYEGDKKRVHLDLGSLWSLLYSPVGDA